MSTKHIFSHLERKYFLDVLKKHCAIIECKETDGATLKAKKEAWEKVARDFNASPHATSQVTSKQLRRLWANLKQRQREALTKERQHRVATGGGPPTSDAVIDTDVAEIAPALIVGIENAIDSDTGPTYEIMSSQDFSASTNVEVDSPPPSSVCQPPSPPHPRTHTPFPNTTVTINRQKVLIIQKEYEDRLRRAEEVHGLEKEILKHKLIEAKAKADLAEKILQQPI